MVEQIAVELLTSIGINLKDYDYFLKTGFNLKITSFIETIITKSQWDNTGGILCSIASLFRQINGNGCKAF